MEHIKLNVTADSSQASNETQNRGVGIADSDCQLINSGYKISRKQNMQ